jgi:SET domain-containing protein
MLLVSTYVGPSAIEGVGVFASEPIRRGTAIWCLDERFDRVLSAADVEGLSPEQREFVDRYGYPHAMRPGMTIVELDNGRFMNHSTAPNTDFSSPHTGVALRDIAAGEELTCDYSEFAPGFEILPGRWFSAPANGENPLRPAT